MRHLLVLLFLVGLTAGSAGGAQAPPASPSPDLVRATIGGVVVETVSAGDRVAEGEPLVYVRTATKPREVAARAPRDGLVAEVLVRTGQRIQIGDPVVRLLPR